MSDPPPPCSVGLQPTLVITVIGLSSVNTELNRDLPLTEVTPESL